MVENFINVNIAFLQLANRLLINFRITRLANVKIKILLFDSHKIESV